MDTVQRATRAKSRAGFWGREPQKGNERIVRISSVAPTGKTKKNLADFYCYTLFRYFTTIRINIIPIWFNCYTCITTLHYVFRTCIYRLIFRDSIDDALPMSDENLGIRKKMRKLFGIVV